MGVAHSATLSPDSCWLTGSAEIMMCVKAFPRTVRIKRLRSNCQHRAMGLGDDKVRRGPRQVRGPGCSGRTRPQHDHVGFTLRRHLQDAVGGEAKLELGFRFVLQTSMVWDQRLQPASALFHMFGAPAQMAIV